MSSETSVRPDLEAMEAAVLRAIAGPWFAPTPPKVELEASTLSALIAYTRALEEAARPFARLGCLVNRADEFRGKTSTTTYAEHARRLAALLPLAEQEGR